MKNFQKIADGVDVIPLAMALQRQPELWSADTYWKNHPVRTFAEVETIMLRFPDKAPHQFGTEEAKAAYLASVDPWECTDQPNYVALPEARPLVSWLMARVAGERLGRILINKLPPGAHIPAHQDCQPGQKYYDRFHIILQTNNQVGFRTGDERAFMQMGEVWWFDNAQEHEVANLGSDDRIHMIVDIRTRGANGLR